ncbi:MAG: hypothetical protein HYT77_07130 [Deltaproteobacteria bacterium]|nr:hypothetical protein [Deltaproteobacteria bacterium]
MKRTFGTALLVLIGVLIQPEQAMTCGYDYHLLHHLTTREVISVTSVELVSDQGGVKTYRAKVTDVLQGSLKKNEVIKLLCSDPMNKKGCEVKRRKSPFIFVQRTSKILPRKTASKEKGKVAKEVLYQFHPSDGVALKAEDKNDLLKFLKAAKKPATVWNQVGGTRNSYIKASVCSLIAEKEPGNPVLPTCLSQVLATDKTVDKDAVLRVLAQSSSKLKRNAGPLCDVVKGSFNQSQPNILNEVELTLRTQLSCSGNANWLLSELQKSENEFVTMLVPYHLAFTRDAAAVKKGVEFFEKNPRKLTTVILDQIAYALFMTNQCDLMDQYIEKGQKHLMGLSRFLPAHYLEGYAENPDWDSIAQHYTRCKGHQPGKAKQLISLLADSPHDWPFPTKGGKVSFQIQQQAVTALEMQIYKKMITPSEEGLKEAMMHQLQSGDPQVVPEVMHFLKRYYSSPEIDSQIMQVAMRPDAQKYWQSHAIMAFMESKQKEKVIQIGQGSRFQQIKKVGELLQKGEGATTSTKKQGKL